MENLKKLISWVLTISPIWLRALILALTAALIFLVSMTSCSRSVLRFSGSGDVTYEYLGTGRSGYLPPPQSSSMGSTRSSSDSR